MSTSVMVLRSGPRNITFAFASRPASISWSSNSCATSGAIASVSEGSPVVSILSCITSSMNSTPETDAVRVCVPSKFVMFDSESPSTTLADVVSKV